MKRSTSLIFASVLFGAFSFSASAANFNGKFDLVQSDPSSNFVNVRYYNAAQALSIFAAPGANASLLQDAFFRKAYVNVSYTPQPCPIGFSGSCGSLTYITVSAGSLP